MIVNWKEFGRKHSHVLFAIFSGILLKWLLKTRKISIRIGGILAVIRTEHRSNTSEHEYRALPPRQRTLSTNVGTTYFMWEAHFEVDSVLCLTPNDV